MKNGEIVIVKPEFFETYKVSKKFEEADKSPFWVVSSLSNYFNNGEMMILLTNMNNESKEINLSVGENDVINTEIIIDYHPYGVVDLTYDEGEILKFCGGKLKGKIGVVNGKVSGDNWYYNIAIIGNEEPSGLFQEFLTEDDINTLDCVKIGAHSLHLVESVKRGKRNPWYEKNPESLMVNDLVIFKPYKTPIGLPLESLWLVEESKGEILNLRSFANTSARVTISKDDIKYLGKAPLGWDMDGWISQANKEIH